MKRKAVHYRLAVSRSIFVVLLIVMISAPPLLNHKPEFSIVRNVLESASLTAWLLVGAAAGSGLFAIGAWRGLTRSFQSNRDTQLHSKKQQTTGGISYMFNLTSSPMAKMPILEVVKQTGGNGLASPPFEWVPEFFGVFGWQQVEAGVEALVIEGEVIQKTRFQLDPLTWLGRRQTARRVLLRPEPLDNLAARALTTDQLDLTITLSISFTVSDPVKVATMQAPLKGLINAINGVTAEHIRLHTLEALVADDGTLRAALCERLAAATTIREGFQIIEVLKALPSGDERLIEMARQKRLEASRSDLVDLEGRNRVKQSEYDDQIARQAMKRYNEQANADHARTREQEQAVLQAANFQAVMKTLGKLAANDNITPTDLLSVLTTFAGNNAPPRLSAPAEATPLTDEDTENTP